MTQTKTMSTQFNQSQVAIVGHSENLDWFDLRQSKYLNRVYVTNEKPALG
jgi:hypothetical protein